MRAFFINASRGGGTDSVECHDGHVGECEQGNRVSLRIKLGLDKAPRLLL
jgi:hypothetical protein